MPAVATGRTPRDPPKGDALLKQAGYPHGVPIKLLYSTLPPMPRLAQSLQSSLSAGGFHVTLVPVSQNAFFASHPGNPASGKRDAWDAAAPRYIRTGSATTGAFIANRFHPPGNESGDYGGSSSPGTNSTIGRAVAARAPALAPACGRRLSTKS